MKILKWNVPVDDKRHLIGGGTVVHVGNQRYTLDSVQVWTMELDLEAERLPQRSVLVVGTGHKLPAFAHPLGTAIAASGDSVWHVVEIK